MQVNNLLKVKKVALPGFEPVTYRSRPQIQNQHVNHSATAPHKFTRSKRLFVVVVNSFISSWSILSSLWINEIN